MYFKDGIYALELGTVFHVSVLCKIAPWFVVSVVKQRPCDSQHGVKRQLEELSVTVS